MARQTAANRTSAAEQWRSLMAVLGLGGLGSAKGEN
jgi:hypothetical protein